jgi:hypothetical protein
MRDLNCIYSNSVILKIIIIINVKASENGTIQLYKKMQAENLAREAEIAELRDRLNRQAGRSTGDIIIRRAESKI